MELCLDASYAIRQAEVIKYSASTFKVIMTHSVTVKVLTHQERIRQEKNVCFFKNLLKSIQPYTPAANVRNGYFFNSFVEFSEAERRALDTWPMKMMLDGRWRHIKTSCFLPLQTLSQLMQQSSKLSNGHSEVLTKFHWVKSELLYHHVGLTHLLWCLLLIVKINK